jgi:hypothetical protein
VDWLQFIAAVIGHLAWPAVIITLIIVLRKRLGALADRLQEFSFGGAKITLEKSLQEGATIIEKIPGAPSNEKPTVDGEGVLQKLAIQLPEGAIIMAYIDIERRLRDISEKLGRKYVNLHSTIQELTTRGILDPEASGLFQSLRRARNSAAHGPRDQLTSADAYEFIRQADFLNTLLESAEARI